MKVAQVNSMLCMLFFPEMDFCETVLKCPQTLAYSLHSTPTPMNRAATSSMSIHTGTALIQLVVAEHHTVTSTPSLANTNHLTPPPSGLRSLNATSTPLVRSPAKPSGPPGSKTYSHDVNGGSPCGSGSGMDQTVELLQVSSEKTQSSGFYWHKNCLLPKQKNVPPGLVGRYEQVMEKFREDCRNIDEILHY